jgi:hypothetical protein
VCQAILDIIQARFPQLVRLATKQMAVVIDSEILSDLIVKISLVQTMEEAKQYLIALDEDE